VPVVSLMPRQSRTPRSKGSASTPATVSPTAPAAAARTQAATSTATTAMVGFRRGLLSATADAIVRALPAGNATAQAPPCELAAARQTRRALSKRHAAEVVQHHSPSRICTDSSSFGLSGKNSRTRVRISSRTSQTRCGAGSRGHGRVLRVSRRLCAAVPDALWPHVLPRLSARHAEGPAALEPREMSTLSRFGQRVQHRRRGQRRPARGSQHKRAT
jgi:hypothetical protein